ncbi:MAG: uracil-DNA glycosylase family protein [Halobacteriaceae archaeon]
MDNMDGLEVQSCRRCDELVESRSQIVNGTGPESTDLLFVGEGPGKQEDKQGEPFVGRSGEVLDDILTQFNISRPQVRITNCVRCRPPENRDPTQQELANCRAYLEAEITQVDPQLLVTLGKVPSEHLLEREVAITNEIGSLETISIGENSFDVLLCIHPAATLYDASQKQNFEQAIGKAAEMINTSGGQSSLTDF